MASLGKIQAPRQYVPITPSLHMSLVFGPGGGSAAFIALMLIDIAGYVQSREVPPSIVFVVNFTRWNVSACRV